MSYQTVESPDAIEDGAEELIISLNATSDLAGFTQALERSENVESIRSLCLRANSIEEPPFGWLTNADESARFINSIARLNLDRLVLFLIKGIPLSLVLLLMNEGFLVEDDSALQLRYVTVVLEDGLEMVISKASSSLSLRFLQNPTSISQDVLQFLNSKRIIKRNFKEIYIRGFTEWLNNAENRDFLCVLASQTFDKLSFCDPCYGWSPEFWLYFVEDVIGNVDTSSDAFAATNNVTLVGTTRDDNDRPDINEIFRHVRDGPSSERRWCIEPCFETGQSVIGQLFLPLMTSGSDATVGLCCTACYSAMYENYWSFATYHKENTYYLACLDGVEDWWRTLSSISNLTKVSFDLRMSEEEAETRVAAAYEGFVSFLQRTGALKVLSMSFPVIPPIVAPFEALANVLRSNQTIQHMSLQETDNFDSNPDVWDQLSLALEESLEVNYCLEAVFVFPPLQLTARTKFFLELNRRGKRKFLYNQRGDEVSRSENWMNALLSCEDVQSCYYFLRQHPILCDIVHAHATPGHPA